MSLTPILLFLIVDTNLIGSYTNRIRVYDSKALIVALKLAHLFCDWMHDGYTMDSQLEKTPW